MFSRSQIILTPKGFALLESMLQRLRNRRDVISAMLACKLDVAKVVPASEIAPDVATLDSRVRYRVNLEQPHERTLVWGASHETDGSTLLVSVPRGLAMIGMSAGQTAAVPKLDGRVESLTLDAVLYQPEHASKPDPREELVRSPGQVTRPAPVTSLSAFRARRERVWMRDGDGDDPGPSAA